MTDIKIAILILSVLLVAVLVHDWYSNRILNEMRLKYYISNKSLKSITKLLVEEKADIYV